MKTLQAIRKEMPADVLVCKNTLMRIAADRVEGFSPLKEATKVHRIGCEMPLSIIIIIARANGGVEIHAGATCCSASPCTVIHCPQGDNAWVFVQEDHIAESVKVYLDFEKKLSAGLSKEAKEVCRSRAKMCFCTSSEWCTPPQAGELATSISGACMDGKFVTPEEFKKLEKLPTKQELIATIARLIKQVPTKVAIGIKQVPTKLAYGVKALADKDDNKEALVGDVCKPTAEGA